MRCYEKMVSNGRWCPEGCGKCVITNGWSIGASWRCLRCEEYFSLEELEEYSKWGKKIKT